MLGSPIEEIKSKLDIVELIGSYIKLQKTGINYRALCPFHSEKKPSFFVSPSRQIFKCFGCGKFGDVFKFVMEIEGLEFGDALRVLAKRTGVELRKQDPKLKTERKRLYDIMELACRFFERQLKESKTGLEVKKYLLERGINEESIKKWRLGYAPNTWQSLSDFLVSKGYEREEVVRAGLAIKKEQDFSANQRESASTSYDRFRGRIIFPVFDLNSQVIGFGGRIFSINQRSYPCPPEALPSGDGRRAPESASTEAKYINTPNTLLYNKSWVLYGLNFAKVEVRRKDACILVEGYTDVILSHQAGFQNTVATSGTALTPFQLKILKRYSQNLISAFDMDIAGDLATRRGIDLAQKEDFQIKVITMSSGTDPADIISKDPKKWEKLIDSAKSILDFYFESTFPKFDKNSAEGKKGISDILLTVIARIPNKISQSHWLQKLSRKLKVSEESVLEELRKVLNKRGVDELRSSSRFANARVKEYGEPSIPEEAEVLKEEKTRREMLEEKILSLIITKLPAKLESLEKNYFSLFSPKSKEILIFLKKEKSKLPPDLKEFLDVLALRSEIEENLDPEREFRLCLKELESLVTKDKLQRISKEIREAEESKDEKRVKELMKEFNELVKKLNNPR